MSAREDNKKWRREALSDKRYKRITNDSMTWLGHLLFHLRVYESWSPHADGHNPTTWINAWHPLTWTVCYPATLVVSLVIGGVVGCIEAMTGLWETTL